MQKAVTAAYPDSRGEMKHPSVSERGAEMLVPGGLVYSGAYRTPLCGCHRC
jgi:hypothetical protein